MMLVRCLGEDSVIAKVTTLCAWMLLQVAEMYRSQEQIVNQVKKKMEVDDDDWE